jgi:predicted RNA-binding Zn ribbon-like protein
VGDVGDADRPLSRLGSTRGRQEHHRGARILDRALRLREAIYCLLSGPGATNADLTTLNEEFGEAMVHARVVQTGASFAWIWPDTDDLARPLWPLAHSAAKLLTSPELERPER